MRADLLACAALPAALAATGIKRRFTPPAATQPRRYWVAELLTLAGSGKLGAKLQLDPEKLKCDLLVAPHDGLNSIPAMAAATKPRFVVVPSLQEYLNPLIRPYELTTSAFAAVDSKVYATWVHGTLTAVSDGRTLKVTTARQP